MFVVQQCTIIYVCSTTTYNNIFCSTTMYNIVVLQIYTIVHCCTINIYYCTLLYYKHILFCIVILQTYAIVYCCTTSIYYYMFAVQQCTILYVYSTTMCNSICL
jgi:hypothetical protein